MTADLFTLWQRQAALVGGFLAMAPFAGFVIATRVTRLMAEGANPSAVGAREAERMVSEKLKALAQGGADAGKVLTRLAGTSDPVAVAGLMIAAGHAAMRPLDVAVRANAKRLSRVRS